MNFWKDLFTPILLSFLSAVIFWIFFSQIPEKKRKRNIRCVLNENIYKICDSLFHILEIPFCPNNYTVSNVQHKLFSGFITEEDFSIALQNKCLNETYKLDEFANSYVCIGNVLEKRIMELDEKIEKLFSFSYYLTEEEIKLLENIRNQLKRYDYTGNAETIVENDRFIPSIPNVAYMANNFFTVYGFFLKLLKLVTKGEYTANDLRFRNILILYTQGKYKKVINFIKKYKKFSDEILYNMYTMLAYYHINNKEKFLKYAELVLQNKPNIISYRNYIIEVYNDTKFKELLLLRYSQAEIDIFLKTYEDEQNYYNKIWENNKLLKKVYENKMNKNA